VEKLQLAVDKDGFTEVTRKKRVDKCAISHANAGGRASRLF
jgi:hypothetical protein